MAKERQSIKSPRKAVKLFCKQCSDDVKNCKGNTWVAGPCPLYDIRLRGRVTLAHIRKHCIMCMNGQTKLVLECPSIMCPLYSFRMGKNPYLKGKLKSGLRNYLIKKGYHVSEEIQDYSGS